MKSDKYNKTRNLDHPAPSPPPALTQDAIRDLARACGFELAGAAAVQPMPDFWRYQGWAGQGFAGEMRYLTDRRGAVRNDPRNILPSAKSVICVGKLYNGPEPYSTEWNQTDRAWISRYAWGEDYHEVLRAGLERLAGMLRKHAEFDYRVCVDTAPLLERSLARQAGLGWIGKNTCLIHEGMGSWFFLGELLISIAMAPGSPPPDRCGTCTRCIDACPTAAIVPFEGRFAVDSRLCISYYTIELRGSVPEPARRGMGSHVFGCDICQDVCPWNRRAPVTEDPAFAATHFAPPLESLAALNETDFRAMFAHTPVERARYSGFLRNVAIAMGNDGSARFREPLRKLSECPDELVAKHARWALERLAAD